MQARMEWTKKVRRGIMGPKSPSAIVPDHGVRSEGIIGADIAIGATTTRTSERS